MLEPGQSVVLKTAPSARALYVLDGPQREVDPPREAVRREHESTRAPSEVREQDVPTLKSWLEARSRAGQPVELLRKGDEHVGHLSANTLQTREGRWRALTCDDGRVMLAPDRGEVTKGAGQRVLLRHGHDGVFRATPRDRDRGMDR